MKTYRKAKKEDFQKMIYLRRNYQKNTLQEKFSVHLSFLSRMLNQLRRV